MRSRCCLCVVRVYVCLSIPLIIARQWLGKNPPIVARQRLGKNPPTVVRQRLGKNPLSLLGIAWVKIPPIVDR
jgi:hypothetical protein